MTSTSYVTYDRKLVLLEILFFAEYRSCLKTSSFYFFKNN